MSKRISFRGKIDSGLEERIRLGTLDGKRGYRIVKFQAMDSEPGTAHYETVVKVYAKSQGSASGTVDFSESDLLAAIYMQDNSDASYPMSEAIIFDNEIFNQDIYVTSEGLTGTHPTSFYLEVETVKLSDVQATQLTLKNLRTIASRS
tara:strand:+ start:31 stop:474 length:444 start_codon:yes stop_codon:yes gene_type:complete